MPPVNPDIVIDGGLRTDRLRFELPDGRYVIIDRHGEIEVADKRGGLNRYRLTLPDVDDVGEACNYRCLKNDDPGVPVPAFHRP